MLLDSMNDLYLIVGPSGVGKTTLVESILTRVERLCCLQKAVTRGLRPGEQQGREVVSIDALSFEIRIADGRIVAPYQKYGEWYGLFSSSGEEHNDGGLNMSVCGIDTLRSTDAITVGDAYEAPPAIAKAVPNVIVIVLYVSYKVIIERLRHKRMSVHQREIRLSTIKQEYENGFPDNVPKCDHLLSAEAPIEVVGAELLSIVENHRHAARRT